MICALFFFICLIQFACAACDQFLASPYIFTSFQSVLWHAPIGFWNKCRFINRDGIDFSDAQNMQPVQVFFHVSLSNIQCLELIHLLLIVFTYKEWDLAENMQGVLEYQTR